MVSNQRATDKIALEEASDAFCLGGDFAHVPISNIGSSLVLNWAGSVKFTKIMKPRPVLTEEEPPCSYAVYGLAGFFALPAFEPVEVDMAASGIVRRGSNIQCQQYIPVNALTFIIYTPEGQPTVPVETEVTSSRCVRRTRRL